MDFTFADILRNLLLATRWTIALALAAMMLGGLAALLVMLLKIAPQRGLRLLATGWIAFFQGTPLLMQLFLIYFGLPSLGWEISPWAAAMTGLTLSASAYLGAFWSGAVEALPKGQWAAARALGMTWSQTVADVILPQAARLALPSTVGFLGVMIKSTALCSIIGFSELLRTGMLLSNATFEPLLVFGLVALIYVAVCTPLNLLGARLEKRLSPARR